MALEVTRAAPVAPQPPPDPATALPAGVRRQVDRAEEAQRKLQPNSGEELPTPATAHSAESPTPAQPTTSAGAHPSPTADQSEFSNGEQPQEDYEQRYRSLEGRYRADMERSAQRAMQLERELAARAAPPPPTTEQDKPLLTPEEIQEYGPDFVDMVQRVAQQSQRPLLSQITQLQSQLEATGRSMALNANDRMHQYMNSAVPGWSEVNNHPDFIAWSRLPDVYSGAIRQGLMQDAWNKGDGPRVEAFFRGFLAEQGVSVPQGHQGAPAAPTQPQPTNGSAGPPQPRVTLESLAAPGRARSAPPQPADKPVYTQAQILKFHTDVATGRFRGSEADRAAIDRDIFAAQHEGRIVLDTRSAAQPPGGFTR